MQKHPIFICSYPKSGRTWLRFILANYMNDYFDLGMEINFHTMFKILPNNSQDAHRGIPAYAFPTDQRIPLIISDHSMYGEGASQFKIIFIIRDIRDTLVSQYFQVSSRLNKFEGSIKEFIRDEAGIHSIINYLNSWSPFLEQGLSLIISYEAMHDSIEDVTDSVLQFIGLEKDAAMLETAITNSAFKKMKTIEVEQGFPNPALASQTVNNNGLRARKGKVGNYTDYLDKDDIIYIEKMCKTGFHEATIRLIDSINLKIKAHNPPG